MKYKFRDIKLSTANLRKLDVVNSIIEEYRSDGYILTLRQLYYQLVSRDIIPNAQNEYAKVSKLLKEGRMAGIVDWGAIEDRLRIPYIPYWNTSPNQAIKDAIRQYRLDRQKGQNTYVEVWVEKDALSGVLKRITGKYHVKLLVNRGYGSVTAMHDAYERISGYIRNGKSVKILYLGDHDPSGIDMIRDITERISEMLTGGLDFEEEFYGLEQDEQYQYIKDYEDQDLDSNFCCEMGLEDYSEEQITKRFSVEAIALTMEQIEQFSPPPNPAKITDPRAKDYIKKYGSVSWEVDALNPETLNSILTSSIEEYIDMDLYNNILKQEKVDKEKLKEIDIE